MEIPWKAYEAHALCHAVPSFLPTDDPIPSLNKEMAFISTTFAPSYPPITNQLETLLNLRNQSLCKDDRLKVMGVLAQRVILLAHRLSGILDIRLQTNQGSLDVTTAKMMVTLQV
ncbi:hypothetical protein Tco_0242024 [Tanacetum coccineum]